MSNGLSNQDSGHRSGGGKKPPPPALLEEAEDTDALALDAPEQEELPEDAEFAAGADLIVPETLETDALEAEALEDEAVAEAEPAPVSRSKHALRLIEARWEEKRLQALLKEVYDDE